MPASPVSGRFVSANLKENDMIEAINIHKHYGVEAVLSGADVRIVPGEKVGMVGRNGAGKTGIIAARCAGAFTRRLPVYRSTSRYAN